MENEEKLKEIAKQLAQPSGTKGLEIADMMQHTNANMTRHAIEQLKLEATDNVLEIGHGNAGHLAEVFQKHPTIHYQGLEISELMHAQAKEKNASFIAVEKANFSLYAGKSIPYAQASFDKVFSVNTIYFWQEPLQMLQEISRVLKTDGLLVLTFALKSFMNSLPFTAYGFELYDLDMLKSLTKGSSLSLQASEVQTESVKSKTGEQVQREYISVLFKKLAE